MNVPLLRWLDMHRDPGSVVGPAVIGLLVVLLTACDREVTAGPQERPLDNQLRQQLALSRALPLRSIPRQDPAIVDLGRALFFDKILSGNRDVSCATCHDPRLGTGDGRSVALGTGAVTHGATRVLGSGRRLVARNSTSLFNLVQVSDLFWDKRIAVPLMGDLQTPAGPALPEGLTNLLAAQAMFPVTDRTEMRGDLGDRDVLGAPNELARYGDTELAAIWDAIMRRVLAIDDYVAKFNAAYPATPASLLGFQHAANAIAAFQVEAFTHNDSPFDRYLAGQDDALSLDAKRGALTFFTEKRCSACHFGAQLGSRTFAVTATPQLGPGVGLDAPLDRGMGDFMFRVPPLRNVEITAPYMHAGTYATLEAVVRHYNNVEKSLREYDVTQVDPLLRAAYHGDAATIDALLSSLDVRLRQPLGLTETEIKELVAFLKSLTDPAARDLRTVVPPSVPSGLPVL